MAKRFFAPVLISGVEDVEAGTVALYVTSDKLEPLEARYHYRVTTPDGDTLQVGEAPITIAPNASQQVATLDFSDLIAEHTARGLLVWLELRAGDQILSENLALLARPKHMEFAAPEISASVQATGANEFVVTLTAQRPALYVWLELPDAAIEVLPVGRP